MSKKLHILFFLMLMSYFSIAQEKASIEKSVLYKYERSFYLSLHSNGIGFGAKFNKFRNGFNKRSLDFSFASVKSPHQYRTQPPYYNGRSYFYGKTNFLYMLRSVIGNQKLITTKPQWGGVEMRWYYHIGLGVGLAKPVYVNIADENLIVSAEKYDPIKHDWQDIYGAASFLMGIDEVKFHPSLTLKTSLDFEFGASDQQINSLEVGGILDLYLNPIEIMGDDNNRFFLLSLYFAFNIGSRFNK